MSLHNETDLTIREIYILEVPIYSAAVFASLAGAVFGLCFGLHLSYSELNAIVHTTGAPSLTIATVLKNLLLYGCFSAVGWSTLVCILGMIIAKFFNAIASTTGGLCVRVRDARDI